MPPIDWFVLLMLVLILLFIVLLLLRSSDAASPSGQRHTRMTEGHSYLYYRDCTGSLRY